MNNLEIKTVIATGGCIGGATCRRFAAKGARVAVFDMNIEAAQRVADEIKDAGGIAKQTISPRHALPLGTLLRRLPSH